MIPIKDNIPTDHFPVVTVLLILLNVAVFLFFQHPSGFSGVDDAKVVKYGAIPYEITHPGKHCGIGDSVSSDGALRSGSGGGDGATVACEGKPVATQSGGDVQIKAVPGKQPSTWLTLLSSMFMHGGWLHLLGNMLFLWIFGNNVEDSMGRVKFILYYVLGGLAALGLQTAIDTGSTVPTVGASGAIAAVLGGYILLHPRAKVLTLVFIIFIFTIIELPALLMIGLWFGQQILFGVGNLTNPTGGGGGVAYFAHIGGFAFGLVFIRAFATRRREAPPPLPVG